MANIVIGWQRVTAECTSTCTSSLLPVTQYIEPSIWTYTNLHICLFARGYSMKLRSIVSKAAPWSAVVVLAGFHTGEVSITVHSKGSNNSNTSSELQCRPF